MKQILCAITMLAFFVCSSCGTSTDSTTTTDTAKTAAKDSVAMGPPPPVFEPFDIMEISHSVKDFSKWKPAFDADSAARKAAGLHFIVIGKNDANPNNLLIVFSADSIQKAKDFAANPRLKDVMKKNGVTSKPDVSYYHIIRFHADTIKHWVMITHKVKDFNAWLKEFDTEGTATRAGYGLSDAVLAQAIGDSNTVQIVFDITDMTKAKARMNDPALKKLMVDAGVIGTPKMVMYTE